MEQYQAIPAALGAANAILALGKIAFRRADLPRAEELVRDARAAYEAMGAQLGIANSTYALGMLARRRNAYESARALFEDAREGYLQVKDELGQANAINALGGLALRQNRLSEAEPLMQDAKRRYRDLGETAGTANATAALARLALRIDEYGQADALMHEAKALYESCDDRVGAANMEHELGLLALYRGQLDDAERLLEQAMAHYSAIDERLGAANALGALGELALRRGRLEESRELLNQSLAGHDAISDRLGAANVVNEIGRLELRHGRLAQAEGYLREALTRYGVIGHDAGIANATYELGELRFRQGRLEEANDLLRDALRRYEEIDDQLGVTNATYDLARLARRRGRLDEGELLLYGARDRYQAVDERLGAANATFNLGRVALGRGRHEEAEIYLRESLEAYREVESSVGLANATFELGRVALRQRRFDGAGDLLGIARRSYRSLDDQLGIANVTFERAKIAAGRGQRRQARRLLNRALKSYESVDDRLGVANSTMQLGVQARAARRTKEAVALFERAIAQYGVLDLSDQAMAQAELAAIQLERGHLAEGAELARAAVSRLDRLRGSLRSVVTRVEHGQIWNSVYEVAVRTLLALAKGSADPGPLQQEAFAIASSFQGRLLYEEMLSAPKAATVDPWSELDEITRQAAALADARLDAARNAQAAFLRRRRDHRNRGRPDGASSAEEYEALTNEVLRALSARTRFLERALLSAATQREPEPLGRVEVPQLQDVIAPVDGSLIDLIWADGLHIAFVLRPESLTVHDYERDSSIEGVDALVAELALLLSSGEADHSSWRDAWLRVTAGIEAALWAPVADQLGTGPTYIVADPLLAAVPFGTFPQLGESSTLRFMPGPTLLLRKSAVAGDVPLLAIGADMASNLAGVGHDMALAGRVAGSVLVRPGNDPLGQLRQDSGPYKLLVFSSHMVHDTSPIGAAIRLAVERDGALHVQDVSSFELLHLPVQAETVVLLGCTGALPSGGTELLSVAAALLVGAQANAVIASLYPVTDLGASLLWSEVLPQLLEGTGADAALAGAIDRLRKLSSASRAQYVSGLRAQDEERAALAHWVEPLLAGLAVGRPNDDQTPLLPVTDLDGWCVFG